MNLTEEMQKNLPAEKIQSMPFVEGKMTGANYSGEASVRPPKKEVNQPMPFDNTWIDYFGDNY